MTSSDSSPSSESNQWSSAIGHASTGKSGRVIERLQGDIDRLRREKQLLKVRHEEAEKATENLATRNQYLQDRNSNYEQSHEANVRQIARKERQVEDLREELRREKLKTAKAEHQAEVAASNEEIWRDQASQAKSLAAQRESEYDTIVACRKNDYERHQQGLDKIKSNFSVLLRRQDDDLEKQKKLEIIAEQQRQTILQLEDLTKKLTTNFKAYRSEIDSAIADLREKASSNDSAITRKLEEMSEVTGQMRWVLNVDDIVNHNHRDPPPPPMTRPISQGRDQLDGHSGPSTARNGEKEKEKDSGRRSPTKGLLTKHRRKESTKSSK
ncbi:uncharacterized protein A1O9_04311 [Exophiala aquamarina CBS 119918]|uniref:SWI5-dependent HO expression protein 3 n=1 Tax=Exophiala aquamarina CBS 119918 TaxID=1182545 RepID=A0A072PI85_9EURO|nr:uncharacterized protein A1O9_04311 [Exophiala aquamarina CBS 119918]KEF59467.1 hypothetical protein A1O9_04311 [Exophiala aquamarina CBS 119918]